jgi:hypothetical protein
MNNKLEVMNSDRVKEAFRYISADERIQEGRSRAWSNDPSPETH